MSHGSSSFFNVGQGDDSLEGFRHLFCPKCLHDYVKEDLKATIKGSCGVRQRYIPNEVIRKCLSKEQTQVFNTMSHSAASSPCRKCLTRCCTSYIIMDDYDLVLLCDHCNLPNCFQSKKSHPTNLKNLWMNENDTDGAINETTRWTSEELEERCNSGDFREYQEDFQCPRCSNSIRNRIEIKKMNIFHQFFKNCLYEFLKHEKDIGILTCPSCNMEMNENEVIKVIGEINWKDWISKMMVPPLSCCRNPVCNGKLIDKHENVVECKEEATPTNVPQIRNSKQGSISKEREEKKEDWIKLQRSGINKHELLERKNVSNNCGQDSVNSGIYQRSTGNDTSVCGSTNSCFASSRPRDTARQSKTACSPRLEMQFRNEQIDLNFISDNLSRHSSIHTINNKEFNFFDRIYLETNTNKKYVIMNKRDTVCIKKDIIDGLTESVQNCDYTIQTFNKSVGPLQAYRKELNYPYLQISKNDDIDSDIFYVAKLREESEHCGGVEVDILKSDILGLSVIERNSALWVKSPPYSKDVKNQFHIGDKIISVEYQDVTELKAFKEIIHSIPLCNKLKFRLQKFPEGKMFCVNKEKVESIFQIGDDWIVSEFCGVSIDDDQQLEIHEKMNNIFNSYDGQYLPVLINSSKFLHDLFKNPLKNEDCS